MLKVKTDHLKQKHVSFHQKLAGTAMCPMPTNFSSSATGLVLTSFFRTPLLLCSLSSAVGALSSRGHCYFPCCFQDGLVLQTTLPGSYPTAWEVERQIFQVMNEAQLVKMFAY